MMVLSSLFLFFVISMLLDFVGPNLPKCYTYNFSVDQSSVQHLLLCLLRFFFLLMCLSWMNLSILVNFFSFTFGFFEIVALFKSKSNLRLLELDTWYNFKPKTKTPSFLHGPVVWSYKQMVDVGRAYKYNNFIQLLLQEKKCIKALNKWLILIICYQKVGLLVCCHVWDFSVLDSTS